jgi:hypothetical protein
MDISMKGEDMAYLIPLMLLVLTAVGCAQPARYTVTEQEESRPPRKREVQE